jgi:hypothetical protein
MINQMIQDGIPVGKIPSVELRNTHLQYAITWYNISSIIFIQQRLMHTLFLANIQFAISFFSVFSLSYFFFFFYRVKLTYDSFYSGIRYPQPQVLCYISS